MDGDRELLERAAEAAGLPIGSPSSQGGFYAACEYDEASRKYGPYRVWNPLTDDGDAFRLAVKLNIIPRSINGMVFAWADGTGDFQEPHNGDPYAAARRAIVRAAAAARNRRSPPSAPRAEAVEARTCKDSLTVAQVATP